MPVEFPADHPVEQFGRLFLACLLKHHELGKSNISSVLIFILSFFFIINLVSLTFLQCFLSSSSVFFHHEIGKSNSSSVLLIFILSFFFVVNLVTRTFLQCFLSSSSVFFIMNLVSRKFLQFLLFIVIFFQGIVNNQNSILNCVFKLTKTFSTVKMKLS